MYIITSKMDRESLELARAAAAYLKENNVKYNLSGEIGGTWHKNLNEAHDIVVAIGDNKFILETFRRLGKSQIPVFAVASTQGFLAQANSLNFKHYLSLIEKGKYEIFKRARLVAKFEMPANRKIIFKHAQKSKIFDKTTTPIGLNDIGLFCSKSASLLKYSLLLNDETFWKDSSDGIIVATPTGSTGYSLSAGGPIVLGEPHIFTVTSISSLEKHSPLVVSDTAKIKIEDIEGSGPMIIVDGEIRVPIHADKVVIEKSPYDANFVIFSKEYAIESRLKKRTLKTSIDKIKGMPASAKLVYKTLATEGNMTQKEIINASLLPERTVRYALDVLLKQRIITSHPHFIDARQTVYGA